VAEDASAKDGDTVNDLIAFLNARLDEDEAIAEAAGGSAPQGVWAQVDPDRRPGRIDCDSGYVVTYDEGSPDDGQAAHIARHDPARALREVAAKRSILKRHVPVVAGYGPLEDQQCCAAESSDEDMWYAKSWPCSTVLALAAVWNDHPGYQDEWKP
jgi:uncharacterized protein DUF6221